MSLGVEVVEKFTIILSVNIVSIIQFISINFKEERSDSNFFISYRNMALSDETVIC